MNDPLKQNLATLHLKAMLQYLDDILDTSKQKNLSFVDTLYRLTELEIDRRRQGAIKLRFDSSRLKEKITIDQFDFHHHKSRKEQKNTITSLLNLEFIDQHADIILIGNPGTGKTFLAKCIGFAACNANKKVLFTSAMDMINQLIASDIDHSLVKKLSIYTSADLLIVDELGYLALGDKGSDLFFQIISARHQNGSTLITTNLPFTEWGRIFNSTTVAAAIADRLVYRSEILIMEGSSYRRKEK
jgi:DNA replication protein DnaC